MTKLFSTIARAFATTPEVDRVHFHGGPHGAFVCEHAACDSPGLDPAER